MKNTEWTKLNKDRNSIYGREKFEIYINKDKTVVYKKNNKNSLWGNQLTSSLKDNNNYQKYKNFIENTIYQSYIGKHVIKGYNVEPDGSYKSKYVDGYRLDRIDNSIDDGTLNKIITQINKLKNVLNEANSKSTLGGDWPLHNLIYSIKDDIIYNVDLEGFFSYQNPAYENNIKHINEWLDSSITKCNKLLKSK